MKIAIIGTGRVGSALAGGWLRAGHTVTFGARDRQSEKTRAVLARLPQARAMSIAEAAAGAEVVVLATPWAAALPALAAAGDLNGKVLVDCTNPVGPDGLMVGLTTSAAEQLAAAAPGARVVKAFNHIGAEVMANPRYAGGQRAVMMYAGDDAAAKANVAALAADLGFEALDAGPLRLARTLEPLALLWITLARSGLGREFAWGLLSR
jgi:8-hydroxy-5-deazaflavin:NADPH oxidoreductase